MPMCPGRLACLIRPWYRAVQEGGSRVARIVLELNMTPSFTSRATTLSLALGALTSAAACSPSVPPAETEASAAAPAEASAAAPAEASAAAPAEASAAAPAEASAAAPAEASAAAPAPAEASAAAPAADPAAVAPVEGSVAAPVAPTPQPIQMRYGGMMRNPGQ